MDSRKNGRNDSKHDDADDAGERIWDADDSLLSKDLSKTVDLMSARTLLADSALVWLLTARFTAVKCTFAVSRLQ